MAIALVGMYMAAIVAQTLAAAFIWRLRCEGFGCMGVGVAWFAWVVAFMVVLGLGLLARRMAASKPSLARACKLAWWFQVGLGALAAAVWLGKGSA